MEVLVNGAEVKAETGLDGYQGGLLESRDQLTIVLDECQLEIDS